MIRIFASFIIGLRAVRVAPDGPGCLDCLTAPAVHRDNDLISAAQANDVAKVRMLLKERCETGTWKFWTCRSYANSRGRLGETALQIAATRGYRGIAKALLDYNASTDIKSLQGWSALHSAAAARHVDLELVDMLLSHRAQPNARDGAGDSPLTIAAARGNIKVVSRLLEYGAKINHRNYKDQNAAFLAAESGQLEMFALLAELGSDMRIFCRSSSSLVDARMSILAVASHDARMVKVALDHGASPWEREFADYSSPRVFDFSLVRGDADVVSEFCAHEVSPRPRDLAASISAGHAKIIQVLLDNGLSADVRFEDGSRPLHLAARRGDAQIAKELLRRGADPGLGDRHQRTPLEVVDRSKTSLVKLLRHTGKISDIAKSVDVPCKPTCGEEFDPILHERFEGEVVIRSPRLSGGKKCFIVRSLLAWLLTRETNPLSNEPYTIQQLREDMAGFLDEPSPFVCVATQGSW